MITLDDVWKSYKIKGVRKPVLDGVSACFPPGRNIAIMGRNGAGKSTLMRLLAGTENPDHGRIHRSVRTSWPLGFAGGFNGTMTGLENIRFVARLYAQDTERVIEETEDFAELGPSLDLPIRAYSSGMRARLAFGLSLAVDFECYLVDEITAVGDRNFKKKSRAALARRLSSASVIMISHSIGELRAYCDCGYLLHQGALHYFDTLDALVEAHDAVMDASLATTAGSPEARPLHS